MSTPSGSSDLAHISTILTTLVNGRPSLTRSTTPTSTPSLAAQTDGSPVRPTPTKLPQFLEHARDKLGVPNALQYEDELVAKGYGPDILHLVSDESLQNIGILPGDVIRLKGGSVAWWNSVDAKRKLPLFDLDDARPNPSTPPNKTVHYERCYAEGGAKTFWGPILEPLSGNNTQSVEDRETSFYCPIRKGMVPIPAGFVVPMTEDNEDPWAIDKFM